MDVHRPGAAVVVVTPDVAQQLLAAEDAAGMLGEVLQQFEFGIGQVQLRAVQLRRVAASSMTMFPVRISGSPAEAIDGLIARRSRTSTSAGPAVASNKSSKPQSADSAASPPSLTITSSGASLPVVSISRHSERAPTRSRRASSRITSAAGASSRAVASA